MSTPSSRPPLRRRHAALLIAALAALGIVVFVYTTYASSRPVNVVAQALAQTAQLQSAGFTVDLTDSVQGKTGAKWQVSGHADRQGKLDATGAYTAGNGQKVSFMVRNPLDDTKSDATYLQLTGTEFLPKLLGDVSTSVGLPNATSPLKSLDQQWIEVPSFLRQTFTQNILFLNRPTSGLTAGEQKQLVALYKQHAFVQVEKALNGETIDGTATRHYRLKLDQAQLGTFLQAVKLNISRLQVTDRQIADAGNVAATVSNFEVWVGRQDGLVHRIAVQRTTDNKRTDIVLNLKDFNKAVVVARPSSSKPLFDALTGIQFPNKSATTTKP